MDNMAVKKQVLDMLKSLMMQSSASKFKPAAVQIDMVKEKPESKEGLKEHLEDASKAKSMDETESAAEEDAEELDPSLEEKEDKKGLRSFLGRK